MTSPCPSPEPDARQRLNADQAARLLRALAGDLEGVVAAMADTDVSHSYVLHEDVRRLSGHLAMVCDLLADHLEDCRARPQAPPGPATG